MKQTRHQSPADDSFLYYYTFRDLSNNPLGCDCNLFTSLNSDIRPYILGGICSSPARAGGYLFSYADVSDTDYFTKAPLEYYMCCRSKCPCHEHILLDGSLLTLLTDFYYCISSISVQIISLFACTVCVPADQRMDTLQKYKKRPWTLALCLTTAVSIQFVNFVQIMFDNKFETRALNDKHKIYPTQYKYQTYCERPKLQSVSLYIMRI